MDNSLDLDKIEILKEIKPFKKVTKQISSNFHAGMFCYNVIRYVVS